MSVSPCLNRRVEWYLFTYLIASSVNPPRELSSLTPFLASLITSSFVHSRFGQRYPKNRGLKRARTFQETSLSLTFSSRSRRPCSTKCRATAAVIGLPIEVDWKECQVLRADFLRYLERRSLWPARAAFSKRHLFSNGQTLCARAR